MGMSNTLCHKVLKLLSKDNYLHSDYFNICGETNNKTEIINYFRGRLYQTRDTLNINVTKVISTLPDETEHDASFINTLRDGVVWWMVKNNIIEKLYLANTDNSTIDPYDKNEYYEKYVK